MSIHFWDNGPQTHWSHDLRDHLIPQVPPIGDCNRVSICSHFRDNVHFLYLGHIDPPYVIFYWCPIVTEPLFSRYLAPQIPCVHTDKQKHTQTHAASDFIFCPMQCIALDRQLELQNT